MNELAAGVDRMQLRTRFAVVIFPLALILTGSLTATMRAVEPTAGDRMTAEYFRLQTAELQRESLADIQSLEQLRERQPQLRGQLLEMLGLDPLPEKTDLAATVTGRVERDDFLVENVHFQSRPHLYVTGNLYLPKKIDGKLPAILYVCGHGGVKKDGVSYGNKVHYQHHGAWFARHGYVCLTIDSLQLGEIEGIHHGTHRYDMWWWLCRGYTPAGVEAWNCVRAVDYLQSRPEVDPDRIGVTGRSGGGAYSWWIATIDERIKAAVPVAGITDLQNHVVDGCVEGHCDCMFFVNTYRWDYPALTALVAPRPLLISNTDRDSIFPLDGVVRTHSVARRIYDLYDAEDKLALHITAGPHKDTQELRVHAFRWMNQHLQNDDRLLEKPAVPFFTMEELQVFTAGLPEDQINTRVSENFVPAAPPLEPPADAEAWEQLKRDRMHWLRERVFRGWPAEDTQVDLRCEGMRIADKTTYATYVFQSQPGIQLPMYVVAKQDPQHAGKPQVTLKIQDADWADFEQNLLPEFDERLRQNEGRGEAGPKANVWEVYFAPRGIGPTALTNETKHLVQTRRRYYLLGQTEDGMRVWDVRRALQASRNLPGARQADMVVEAGGTEAGIALYAALFEPGVSELRLRQPTTTHHNGPYFLNVMRRMDLPTAVAMAAEGTRVEIESTDIRPWAAAQATAEKLGWPSDQLKVALPQAP
jgi:dienelactone hydrolase